MEKLSGAVFLSTPEDEAKANKRRLAISPGGPASPEKKQTTEDPAATRMTAKISKAPL